MSGQSVSPSLHRGDIVLCRHRLGPHRECDKLPSGRIVAIGREGANTVYLIDCGTAGKVAIECIEQLRNGAAVTYL